MRSQLVQIAKIFKNEPDFIIVSHTIDSKHDSVHVLKKYAESTKIPSIKWFFIRSTEEHTKRQAEYYMTNFKPNDDGTDFYHSSYVALVDDHQMIRGFYDILIPEEVERLKWDINILLD